MAYASPLVDNPTPNLTGILSRLEAKILTPDADPLLRTSFYRRKTVGANVEYARSLLLKLEHESSSIKIQSIQTEVKADLRAKRNLIKQLNQRLYELDQLDPGDSDGSDSEPDDNDIFPSYAPAKTNTSSTIDHVNREENPALQAAAANLSSTLRSRKAGQAPQATSTSSSLFNARSTVDPGSATTETLLSHNRTEQDNLTASLLDMAKALKNQSLQFSSALEDEKSILDRAVSGLDKNTTGMEAAGQRMGTLRRMTEGKGWWDRMYIYRLT